MTTAVIAVLAHACYRRISHLMKFLSKIRLNQLEICTTRCVGEATENNRVKCRSEVFDKKINVIKMFLIKLVPSFAHSPCAR